MMSVTHYALKLPIAQSLMRRREEAIPVLLLELRDNDGGMAIMTLLQHMLPDVRVYEPEDVGAGFVGYRVGDAAAAWVSWGISNGLIGGN